MKPRHLGEDRGQAHAEGDPRDIEAQNASHVPLPGRHPLGCGVDLVKGALCGLDEHLPRFGQRDAACGACEQWRAEMHLSGAHRMADGRGAQIEFGGGADKAARSRDGDHNGQMRQQGAIHS